MMSVDEARAAVLARIDPLNPVDIPLDQAHGLVTATDIVARGRLPRFDNSAMDGYAIRSADVLGATSTSPVELSVVGEVRAARGEPLTMRRGESVRIATGGAVPPDADAVVPLEETTEVEGAIKLSAAVPRGRHIRRAAEDIEVGDTAVPRGIALGAGELAILAALGHHAARVRQRPRVGVLVTGDELVPPTGNAGHGQIYDSNSTALAALVREAGAEVSLLEVVEDTPSATIAALEQASRSSDFVVSCGGVSVGPYDLVKDAVDRIGTVDHWRVAMQPGKPVVIGKVHDVTFLGLPGNPVSVHVTFEQFARPALRKMAGHRALLRPRVRARLTKRVVAAGGRRRFVRVHLSARSGEVWEANPTGPQGSHIQSSLVDCDGLAIVSEDQDGVQAGETVEVEVWRLPTR